MAEADVAETKKGASVRSTVKDNSRVEFIICRCAGVRAQMRRNLPHALLLRLHVAAVVLCGTLLPTSRRRVTHICCATCNGASSSEFGGSVDLFVRCVFAPCNYFVSVSLCLHLGSSNEFNRTQRRH